MEKFDELLTLICEASISNIGQLQRDLYKLKTSFDENRRNGDIRGMKRDLNEFEKVVDELDSEIESLKRGMVGNKVNDVSTVVKRVGVALTVIGKVISLMGVSASETKKEELIHGASDAIKARMYGNDIPESFIKAKREYDLIQKVQSTAAVSYVVGTTATVGGRLAQKSVDLINNSKVGTTYKQLKYVTSQMHSMLKSMEKAVNSLEKSLSKTGRKKMTESVSESLLDSVLSGYMSNDDVSSILSIYKNQ